MNSAYLLSQSRIRCFHGGADVREVNNQVPGQLCGPGRGGMGGGAEDADAAGGVFNGGEDVQPCAGQCPNLEEVGGEDRVCSAAQERGPGMAIAVRHGIDVGALEDFPGRRRGDLDAQGGQLAVDASVAPARVLPCPAQDEGLDAANVGGRPGRFRRDCLAW